MFYKVICVSPKKYKFLAILAIAVIIETVMYVGAIGVDFDDDNDEKKANTYTEEKHGTKVGGKVTGIPAKYKFVGALVNTTYHPNNKGMVVEARNGSSVHVEVE